MPCASFKSLDLHSWGFITGHCENFRNTQKVPRSGNFAECLRIAVKNILTKPNKILRSKFTPTACWCTSVVRRIGILQTSHLTNLFNMTGLEESLLDWSWLHLLIGLPHQNFRQAKSGCLGRNLCPPRPLTQGALGPNPRSSKKKRNQNLTESCGVWLL